MEKDSQLGDDFGSTPSETVPVRSYRYDRQNTGHHPKAVGPKKPVQPLWTVEGGLGSPAVVDGHVYTGVTGGFAAIDARNGSIQWQTDISRISYDGPAIIDETIYVGADAVYALDVVTGAIQWTFQTRNRAATPTVVDGTVYVGDFNGHLYALDASDGTEQWTFETTKAIRGAPAVANGRVFVRTMGTNTLNIFALSATDGAELWNMHSRYQVPNSPVVADGTVYIGSRDLLALDVETGRKRWKYDAWGVATTPAVANGVVYAGTHKNRAIAIDATTGKKRWDSETAGRVLGSPTVADGTVYLGDEQKTVYAFATDDGRELWTFETDDEIRTSPIVTTGRVYVGNSRKLYALVKTGAL